MGRLLLASAASVAGALLVGPALSYRVIWWIGSRGVVPLLLGWQPARGQVGSPRPACRRCRDTSPGSRDVPMSLSPGDLPVLPWLAVLGRCRRCGEPIGRWALWVEVTTGLGFGIAAARFGWSVELLPVVVLAGGLVAASAVDLVCHRIPTSFVYVTATGVVAALGSAVVVEHEAASLVGALVGAATCWGLLGLQYLVALVLAGGNFGLGDVRLGTVIGLVLGWLGWIGWPASDPYPALGSVAAALTGLVVGSLTAAIAGLVVRAVRRRREPYPFGPWLSLGGFVAALLVV